jgi:hypothetical protein
MSAWMVYAIVVICVLAEFGLVAYWTWRDR